MITWLQQNVFKHQRVLFGFLLTIVVVAFVLFSGNGRSFLDSTRGPRQVEFLGLEINNPRVREPLVRHSEISSQLTYERGDMIQRATHLVLCDKLGVPEPTSAQIAKHIEKVRGLQSGGKADRARLTSVIDNVKTRYGISQKAAELAVEETLAEDWRIDRLEQILGSPSVLLPAEALARARDEKTTRSVDVAEMTFADFSAKNPTADPSPEVLEKYFKENAASYAVPAKPRHTAVVFEGAAIVPALEIKPTEEEIKAYFERNKAKYVIRPLESGIGPVPSIVEPTLEGSRDKVLADLTAERLTAKRDEETQLACENFLEAFAADKLGRKSPAFEGLIAKFKGRLIALPALGENDPALPQPFLAGEFSRATEHLSATEPFTLTPVKINGGYATIFFDALEPGRPSTLDEVRVKAVAKWKETEADATWNKTVTNAREELAKAVAAGGNFKEAAEKAGFKVTPVEDFTVSNVPVPALRDFLTSARIGGAMRVSPALEKLKQGEVSPNLGGRIAYLRKITVPTFGPEAAEVAAVVESSSKELSESGFSATVLEVYTRELERINPKKKAE